MKKSILFFFLLASATFGAANSDSLLTIWENKALPDSSRIEALSKFITNSVLSTNPDSAKSLNDELYIFSEMKKNDVGLSYAYQNYSSLSSFNGDYNKALDFLYKGLAINKRLNDNNRIAITYSNIAYMHNYLGNYDKAMDYNNRSLKIQKKLNNKLAIVRLYNNIGLTYDYLGNNNKAIEYYELAVKLAKEIDYKEGISSITLNIALIYYDLGDMEKALVYVTKSLEMAKKDNNKFQLANAYSNVGYVNAGMKNYDEALENYNKSLKLYVELNDIKGISNGLFVLGELAKDQGDYEQSLWYFKESLKSYEKAEQPFDISACYMNIGKSYLELKNTSNAIKNCEKGYMISNKIGAMEIEKDACECLYEAYKVKGNDKKALQYKEISEKLADSISNVETAEKVAQLENERKMLADSLSKKNKKIEAKLKESNSIQYLLFLGSGLLVVLIAGTYLVKRKKSKRSHLGGQENAHSEREQERIDNE